MSFFVINVTGRDYNSRFHIRRLIFFWISKTQLFTKRGYWAEILVCVGREGYVPVSIKNFVLAPIELEKERF